VCVCQGVDVVRGVGRGGRRGRGRRVVDRQDGQRNVAGVPIDREGEWEWRAGGGGQSAELRCELCESCGSEGSKVERGRLGM
jgi:hypothetical protein